MYFFLYMRPLYPLTVDPKKSSSNSTRKVVRTTIKLKKEIIVKFENGVVVSDLVAQYNMVISTISTFLKNKQAIKAADVA